jgi:hypothetical protein
MVGDDILSKRIDITGKVFNELTVLEYAETKNGCAYWRCQCSCGNIVNVRSDHLRGGKIKSCGCKVADYVSNSRHISLVGKRFGRLSVISEAGKQGLDYIYKCKCDCGNETLVLGTNLRTGNTKSCGCLHREIISCVGTRNIGKYKDLVGQRFGRLTVVNLVGGISPIPIWHCKCDCGNEIDVRRDYLVSGQTKSCGCLKTDKIVENRRFGKLVAISPYRSNGRTYWKCKCDCGSELDVELSHLVDGHTQSCGCLDISHSGSKDENVIKDYIGIECVKDKSVLGGKEIDLYYPKFGIGIEFNGSAYHANKNGVYKDLPKMYHRDKFLEAKEKGVHLISIFDVDWWNNQDKIKMYLDSIFKPKKSIYARKCEIKSITKELADEFTDKYHLQGHTRFNTINYGLYLDNDLLAVMSFGKYRLKKNIDGHYELHRYCVKDGITIVGGANKLLKAFEREYNPKELLSFSDNDYFSGGIYERLGFDNDGQATPRYYWFLNGVEVKREQCQLKKLKVLYGDLLQEAYDVGASNKEDYVMLKLGARKVYRCGNTRWIKKY